MRLSIKRRDGIIQKYHVKGEPLVSKAFAKKFSKRLMDKGKVRDEIHATFSKLSDLYYDYDRVWHNPEDKPKILRLQAKMKYLLATPHLPIRPDIEKILPGYMKPPQ